MRFCWADVARVEQWFRVRGLAKLGATSWATPYWLPLWPPGRPCDLLSGGQATGVWLLYNLSIGADHARGSPPGHALLAPSSSSKGAISATSFRQRLRKAETPLSAPSLPAVKCNSRFDARNDPSQWNLSWACRVIHSNQSPAKFTPARSQAFAKSLSSLATATSPAIGRPLPKLSAACITTSRPWPGIRIETMESGTSHNPTTSHAPQGRVLPA